MAQKIIMPKQGLQMEVGIITQWLHQEGDEIREGEPLFEMETDKLSITIDASASGTLLKILREEGEDVPVADTIAIVGEPGEDISALLAESGGDAPAPEPAANPGTAPEEPAPAPTPSAPADGRLFATPRARMHAEERGIDLADVTPSGPDGLIIDRDIPEKPAAAPVPVEPSVSPEPRPAGPAPRTAFPVIIGEGDNVIPLTGMRRTIAQRMHDSLSELAQANHRMEVDMTEAVRMREKLKGLGFKFSYNDLILRCVAHALERHPSMNAGMTKDAVVEHRAIGIGMAVATPTGLLVPVIRDANRLSLAQIAESARDLAQRAKEGRLSPDELTGGTFTVTNLGMYGIDSFTPIINAPEAGILGVGAIKKRAVVLEDDTICARPMMWLSLTYDHRVVDGAPAAEFLRTVRDLLENPMLMF